MVVNALTTKEYWRESTGRIKPFMVNGNVFASVLEKLLPTNDKLTCVEVGAYPGDHLCYFAKRFGYLPTAIEFRDDVEDIVSLFAYNGLAAPEILNGNFFDITDRQFDLVLSFGFAEHFDDFAAVIACHARLVRPGGYLVLSIPHLWGYQWLVRRLLYTEEAFNELRRSHNLAAMHLGVVKKALRQNGLALLHAGYAMNTQFWVAPDSPKIRPGARKLVAMLNSFDRRIGRWLPNSLFYSPIMLFVCKK